MAELKEEFQEMNNSMEILQKKLDSLISQRNDYKNNIKPIQKTIRENSPSILKPDLNISNKNKISDTVLNLAINSKFKFMVKSL